jgi:hypothetical protein
MQKVQIALFTIFIAVLPLAADSDKETDRVEESGQVMKEIVNIPDNIPKDLVDRAECVIVLPSVKKLAIGIGGSYGRGVMTPYRAALYRIVERAGSVCIGGRQYRFSTRRPGDRFRAAGDESARCHQFDGQQSKTRS